MKKLTMVLCIICLVGSMVFAGGATEEKMDAAAQQWPTMPIQVMVGANAGGGIDTAARLMAKYLEVELGKPVIISNMSGGAGSIAANKVKDSKADGYTMLVCHEALLTNKIAGITTFDNDAFADGGIALKIYTTCLLSKKYTTFDAMVADALENPGKVKFGTEAATNDTHIIAMMERNLGTEIQIVDSGAISNQIASMMGNHIDFMKSPIGLAKDYVRAGEFNVLGFFTEERIPAYPNVPALKEKGVDFVVDKFFYSGFPLGTSPVILDKYSAALKKVSENPAFIAEANKLDYTVDYMAPAEIPPFVEKVKVNLVKYQELYDEVMGY